MAQLSTINDNLFYKETGKKLCRLKIALMGEGAKAKRKPAEKLSTADLHSEAHRMVWEYLADHLKKMSRGTQIVKELERPLIAT